MRFRLSISILCGVDDHFLRPALVIIASTTFKRESGERVEIVPSMFPQKHPKRENSVAVCLFLPCSSLHFIIFMIKSSIFVHFSSLSSIMSTMFCAFNIVCSHSGTNSVSACPMLDIRKTRVLRFPCDCNDHIHPLP